jgi:type I restriction enzyme R subunit
MDSSLMNTLRAGGFSNPPKEGGQESPPADSFLNPYAPIQKHKHRLPHWQQGSVYYFVTWRLADSLPKEKLARWREERDLWLSLHPRPWDTPTETEFHERFSGTIDEWLDASEGSCVLRDRVLAGCVAHTLLHFDSQRYVMDCFVVMPNHVHALFRLLTPHRLESVVKSWKGFSAREINRRLKRRGSLWQEDYWDRLIRNESHWASCRDYIRENPVKARLPQNQFMLFVR